MLKKKLGACSLFLLTCVSFSALRAEDSRSYAPSTNMMGTLGLNTIPSARMYNEGVVNATLSRDASYTHASIGAQLTDRFYLGIRQTSESKNFTSESLHLYPGLDAKWMLYPESRYAPQISVGLQSAFGHKRMAAEYLALSKRYRDFDFTFGFGWGRMATRDTLPNPILLNNIGVHHHRDIDGESPNVPSDWFKGDMALFGGIEYATPIDGLSLKTDWNSDAWTAEKKADSSFNAPAPWSVGLTYRPLSWMDAGIAYSGNNTVMARVSFTGNVGQWPWTDKPEHLSIAMASGRPNSLWSDDTDDDTDDNDDVYEQNLGTENRLGLSYVFIQPKSAEATITLKENSSTPRQIGEASRYLSNIAGPTPEQIILHIRGYGLQGQTIILNRADLERAFLKHQGSAEEIWQTLFFSKNKNHKPLSQIIGEIQTAREEQSFKLNLINDVSLSEEDSGVLYRTALQGQYQQKFGQHFLSLLSGRLNIADNLQKLNDYRGVSLLPVRGDIDKFTQDRLEIDRYYFMGLMTPFHNVHFAAAIGYLEEMYAGISGELLYRPFGKNWAIGLEPALALKRDPSIPLALGLNGDHILTGFLNGYYEIPDTGTTMKASIGRFLAGDVGGTVSLTNEFKNGVQLSANISASNKSDNDIYGGRTNFYTGVHVSLPLGSLKFIPDGSRVITNITPLGRDMAQRLDNPTQLYERTDPLSYRHLTRQWSNVGSNVAH